MKNKTKNKKQQQQQQNYVNNNILMPLSHFGTVAYHCEFKIVSMG